MIIEALPSSLKAIESFGNRAINKDKFLINRIIQTLQSNVMIGIPYSATFIKYVLCVNFMLMLVSCTKFEGLAAGCPTKTTILFEKRNPASEFLFLLTASDGLKY